MDKMNEFGRRLRLVWVGLVTLLAVSLAFEAYAWWLPLAASPLAYTPLFAKIRMSVRLACAGVGLGIVFATLGKYNYPEFGLVLMAFSVILALIWEVVAFLLSPFFKRSDAQQLPPR